MRLKIKLNRAVAACAIIAFLAFSIAASVPVKAQSLTLAQFTLTIVGPTQTVTVTQNNITALPATSASGGWSGHGGAITSGNWVGVSLQYLCNLVGGISANSSVAVAQTIPNAYSSTYSQSFTYQQIYNTAQSSTFYNATTGNTQTPALPITLIVAYEYNGAALPLTSSQAWGPLRLVAVGPEGLVSKGSLSVSCVDTITITGAQTVTLPSFSLTVTGAKGTVTLTQANITALPATTGLGGWQSSGTLNYVGVYTGVSLQYLCNLVGGATSGCTIDVQDQTGSSPYDYPFNYNQIFNTASGISYWFNPTTGASQNPTQPINLIIAYEYNGGNLPSSWGALRDMTISPEGLVTYGMYSVYLINQIVISGYPTSYNQLTANTCNSAGTAQSTFESGSNVYLTATGLSPSTTYTVSVVPHQTAWMTGMPIPTPLATASVTTSSSGNIASTSIYTNAAKGQYDILVKPASETDGTYDASDLLIASATGPGFTVTYTPLVAPTVSASPSTVDQGHSTSLTSTAATTGTSPYTYQWLSEAPSASSYTAITGATSASYSFATTTSTATGTWNFKLQVTDASGSVVTSNAASVIVNAALAAPTVSASASAVNEGQSSSLSATTVTTGTSPYTYQWLSESPSASSYTAISGANSAAYSFATSTSTATGAWNFELQVTDQAGVAITSNAVSVTVNSALACPVVSASSSTVDQGQSSSLTSTATTSGTSPYSYQWLSESPGASSYTAITGATSSSYTLVTSASTTSGTWSFELQVTDNTGTSVTSNAAAVEVNSALTAPTVTASSSNVTQGQSISLTSAAVATGTSSYTYQWYSEAPSASTYTAISGATSASYTFATSNSTASGNWSFTLVVKDAAGSTVRSSVVSVTVSAPVNNGKSTVPEYSFGILAAALVIGLATLILCCTQKRKVLFKGR